MFNCNKPLYSITIQCNQVKTADMHLCFFWKYIKRGNLDNGEGGNYQINNVEGRGDLFSSRFWPKDGFFFKYL